MHRPRRAFTLVELLTVIAIVGVLAGIVIVSVGAVRENARGASCLNNLRQISTGVFLYAADNGNRLPAPSTDGTSEIQTRTWGYAVWPYVYGDISAFSLDAAVRNNLQMGTPVQSPSPDNIFRCQTNRMGDHPASGARVLAARFSYGLNCGVANAGNGGAERRRQIPLNTVVAPSRSAMIIECSSPFAHRDVFFGFGLAPHGGKTNVVFFDGHVRALAFSEIPASGTDRFWRFAQ